MTGWTVAEVEQVNAAERRMAAIRLVIVGTSVALLFLLDRTRIIPWLAFGIGGVAIVYGLYVYIREPHRRHALAPTSLLTTIIDALLIVLWVYSTGAVHSPFYVLLYLAVVAVSFEYPPRQCLLVSLVYAGSYVGMVWLAGQLHVMPVELLVRITFVIVAALLGATISSEVGRQTATALAARQRSELLSEVSSALAGSFVDDTALTRATETVADHLQGGCILAGADGVPRAMALSNRGRPDESEVRFPLVSRGERLGELRALGVRNDQELAPLMSEVARRFAMYLDAEQLYRQAQEAIRARDEFLSVASHELRTPVHALNLSLAVLERKADSWPPSPDRIQVLRRQTRQLGVLLNSLLDVSRIGAGRLQITASMFDLTELVGELAARFTPEVAAANCRLRHITPAPVLGAWDRVRIEQAVTNLISNAIRHAPGSAIEVTVEGTATEAIVRVRDEGPGIDPHDLHRVFGRFERAAGARSDGGLGLGLYITREIVEVHGGRISVDSEPGRGATFEIRLPRTSVAARAHELDRAPSLPS